MKYLKKIFTLGTGIHKCVYKTNIALGAKFLIICVLMESKLKSIHKNVTKWFWLSHGSAS